MKLSCVGAGRAMDEWQRLLHIVIVGGGPTGVEVAGELSDLINRDLKKMYPERARAMRWGWGPACCLLCCMTVMAGPQLQA